MTVKVTVLLQKGKERQSFEVQAATRKDALRDAKYIAKRDFGDYKIVNIL